MKPVHLFLCTSALITTAIALQPYRSNDVDYFLKRSGIQKTQFKWNKVRNGNMLVTDLDNFRGFMVWMRQVLLNNAYNDWNYLIKYNWKMGKIQRPRLKGEEFPCKLNNTRSREPPKSVHKLRPGDIDIVGAIGDSLSAGNGIISEQIIHIAMEFRGLAFSGGGIEDWRTVLTLPNILKVFNPKLYGFATGEVLTVNRNSHLNIAEPMIMSRDLVYQSNIFIARLKSDPKVDFKNHWKLLTIFVGNNDICSDMCHHDNMVDFLRKHERDLRNAFTLLRDNVPRLVINLLSVPNMVTSLLPMKNIPLACQAVHRVGCHCIFSELYSAEFIKRAYNYITRWQAVDKYVAELPEFKTDDFIVLYQPFTANVSMPILANGDTDLRYFSSDCFHFSQLGHAAIANALWNSMLQPKGKKQTIFLEPFAQFECPTEEKPFIVT
ncbi:phospholipase B1, membrane-associated-like isoform X1 [Lucilia sericata]|uniref:phospholipase B1, membrane-associated-like isoform X1 n=1 Tax=Lucilia sericata TaxID=13632 RepID=UPI0018A834F9|nr:phospholipase B1, membrane-associated-like isoform X1 [Lucilia sericata]